MSDLNGESPLPEPRDGLETWLSEPVQPLLPPPGAFERIRRRARRRKMMRAAATMAGVAAVLVSAVTVPRLVMPQFTHQGTAAGGMASRAAAPEASAHLAAPQTAPAPSATPVQRNAAQASRMAAAAVPADIRISSVTFVSKSKGWIIGQAGKPGNCASFCTAVARTDNGGRSWQGVNAPPAAAPNGSNGVSQIRFLDGVNGWAFGPALWATHDGGRRWRQVPTLGLRVIALETVDGRAFAVWAHCYGIGSAYTAGCTRFYLFTTPAGRDHWRRVPGPALAAPGRGGGVTMALSSSRVYLLGPGRTVVSVPISAPDKLTVAAYRGKPGRAPCTPGMPAAGRRPTGALLAATGKAPQLIVMCLRSSGPDRQVKHVYWSFDGGGDWTLYDNPPAAGLAASLSGTLSGGAVLATTRGIDVTSAIGKIMAGAAGTMPSGGFAYVGMTTRSQGVAIPADGSLHSLWFSYDGGFTWVRCPVTSRR